MNKQTEALKLALENAQPSFMAPGWTLVRNEAITAIREALAEQPAQQPEPCQCPECQVTPHASDCAVHNEPAYPKGACSCKAQPRQWQGLTDAEIAEGQRQSWVAKQAFESAVWWAEAKLREKNT